MTVDIDLARKNRKVSSKSWELLKGGMIKQSLREKKKEDGTLKYPNEDSEFAINRKQIAHILKVLKVHGIDAALPEFVEYDGDAEGVKTDIKKFMEGE